MAKIEQGTPLWDAPLNEILERLQTEKAEKLDVIPEVGTITLTNTKQYPFNNSEVTVKLGKERDTLDYVVVAEVVSNEGPVGDVDVYDKATNGFKIAFTGSGTKAVIKYYITGGF